MATLDRVILDLVDGYWIQFLDCSLDALRSKTAQVLAHAEHASYAGCHLIEFGAAPVISLPADEVTVYRAAVSSWGPGVVRTPALVEAVFRERVAVIIGPAFIGYTDLTHFRPVSPGAARPLSPSDEQGVERLRDACTGEEWDHGGSEFRPDAMVGVFRDHQLVALASYESWGKHLAHVSIVAHPFFRGQGHAEAAVSELTKIILERKLVPQYRTLDANDPSMAIAHRLGFVLYATSLAVRFRL